MGVSQNRVAVLMTCHDRAQTTVRCLASLARNRQENPEWSFDLYLVDDGSADGTSKVVKAFAEKSFPANLLLHLIAGTGTLFWARGMNLAWQVARNERMLHDGYVWLNDDVVLMSQAFRAMLRGLFSTENAELHDRVVVGACQAGDGACIYGAVDAHYHVIDPRAESSLLGRWMNGNVVVVPRAVCEKIGIISDEYSHGRADYDYAERLRLAGIPLVSSSEIVGTCEYNYDRSMRGETRRERLALLFKPGYWNLHDLWLIRSRYYGKMRAIISCAHHVCNALRG